MCILMNPENTFRHKTAQLALSEKTTQILIYHTALGSSCRVEVGAYTCTCMH